MEKDHLPSTGKLQFRLQVTGIGKNSSNGSKGEIGESGFITPTPVLVKDHADVMSYNASNDGSASVSSSAAKCGNSRNISATIKFRRIQQLDSWADIQLINFTTVDNGVFPFMPDFAMQNLAPDKKWDQYFTEGLLSNSHSSYQVTTFNDAKPGKMVTVRTPQPPSSGASALNKGVIRGSEWERGQQTMNSRRWDGKGFAYYQAALEDITAFGRFPAATISFTLYHEDVIKYAGEKDYHWFDFDGERATIGIKSAKIPNTNSYKVDIKLLDSGDWLEEANLVAYVYVNGTGLLRK